MRRIRTTDKLDRLARWRARQIYTDGFYHKYDWVDPISNWRGVGENIAWRRPAPDNRPRWAFEAFRDSDVHRHNMLGRWNRMGSGFYLAPDGKLFVAQLFVLK